MAIDGKARCLEHARQHDRTNGSPSRRVVGGKHHRQRRARILAEGAPWTCGICGRPITNASDLVVDHITPVSRGGSDDDTNTQTAHRVCNGLKGANVRNEPSRQAREQRRQRARAPSDRDE